MSIAAGTFRSEQGRGALWAHRASTTSSMRLTGASSAQPAWPAQRIANWPRAVETASRWGFSVREELKHVYMCGNIAAKVSNPREDVSHV